METSPESLKTYSVVVVMQDGQSRAVAVKGNSPGDAFRRAKEMAGVRSVGKVTEGFPPTGGAATNQPQPRAASHGRGPSASTASAGPSHAAPTETAEPQPGTRERLTGNTISGPRVVLEGHRGGGERPFRNLYVPPERLRPEPVEPPPAPAPKPVAERPAAPQAAPAQPVPSSSQVAPPAAPAAETGLEEYRIVKSRRRGGDPYLLQRGRWQGGSDKKRTFEVLWEQGFATREAAEAHQNGSGQGATAAPAAEPTPV